MKRTPLKVKNMVQCAICAALLAISAWLCIPMPQVSFTMQSFAVFFILGLLGGRRGTLSIFIYLMLGLLGLPVFSGFRGGAEALLGVTGGYIWGFLLSGLIYWAVTALISDSAPARLAAMIFGMAVCYACGTVWYLKLYGGNVWAVLATCVAPYVVPDAVKIGLSVSLAKRLKQAIR